MNVNSLYNDILRGAWLVNPNSAREYEKLANNFLTGNFRGTPLDKSEVLASASQNYALGQEPEISEKKIVMMTMRGIIPAYGDLCIYGADDYLRLFRMFNENDSVGAIIVNASGPGSSVSAINMMKEFAAEKKKPIVWLSDQCCSGYMWSAALLADHHMAYGNISPEFGSIGVLSTVLDSREAMAKEGYKVLIVRAPQSTTKGQAAVDFYEGRDEEFIKGLEDEMFPMAEIFIDEMKTLRPNMKMDTEGLFTGSTYNATKALEIGLIDSIGDEKKAFQRAQMLMEMELY